MQSHLVAEYTQKQVIEKTKYSAKVAGELLQEISKIIKPGISESVGFVFNLNPVGHLIGSFPHKGWKEGLNTYPFVPESGYWILEIQIRHPEKSYGAFYEAVLI